jgi:hypothetical protein
VYLPTDVRGDCLIDHAMPFNEGFAGELSRNDAHMNVAPAATSFGVAGMLGTLVFNPQMRRFERRDESVLEHVGYLCCRGALFGVGSHWCTLIDGTPDVVLCPIGGQLHEGSQVGIESCWLDDVTVCTGTIARSYMRRVGGRSEHDDGKCLGPWMVADAP